MRLHLKKKSRTELAQEGYKRKDIVTTRKAHTKKAIKQAAEEHTKELGKYLGDIVYGALDGIVTTFAVVSGVEGAQLSSVIIIVLGFANLFGDGLSMAVGNYLSNKSDIDYIKRERKREEWEIDHYPEGEKEELRQIFQRKGFTGKDLQKSVDIVSSNKEVWIDTMMKEELGLISVDKTPVQSSIVTFIAFVLAGLVPLFAFMLSYFFPVNNPFFIAIFLTGASLFLVGAMRTFVTGVSWWRSGFEMFLVGSLAAAAAYFVGFILRGII